MAQTRRKRRTKHRGTPAGTIETRGRTGRPPTADERKRQTKMTAREKRLNTPPSWRSSVTRAVLAGVLVFLFLYLTAKKDRLSTALAFTLVAVMIYIPAGYYLELALFRRRQRKSIASGGSGSGRR